MPKTIMLLLIYCILCITELDARIDVYNQNGKNVHTFRDRGALCGDDFQKSEGLIVLASPEDACSPLARPAFFTNFTLEKFVLINGSNSCTSITKATNAERAMFDLAVIFDPSESPFECINIVPFPGPDLSIPVVFLSYEDGVLMKNKYLYNNSFSNSYIIIVRPDAPDMTYYMYLFAAVIGVCFFIMLLFMICLIIKCLQERRKSRRNRLSRRQIKQIPTAKFSKGDQYDVCAICLEDYKEGDKLRILPCSHAYHARCIDPWLMNNRRNCPLCKRKITLGDSNSDSDSEDSELTSPSENTPLITTPSNRGSSWGTFAVNPVNSLNSENEDSGPSSIRNEFLARTHFLGRPAEVDKSPETSYDETEEELPSPHCSVNNGKEDGNGGQTVVHVLCETDNTASSAHHGLVV